MMTSTSTTNNWNFVYGDCLHVFSVVNDHSGSYNHTAPPYPVLSCVHPCFVPEDACGRYMMFQIDEGSGARNCGQGR